MYAEKKAAENIRGRGRIGSSTAIQSRRGLVGSDFGASQTEAVHGMNKAAMDAIQAEQRAELQAIMSQVRNSVAAELAAKTAAQKQGAEEYVTFLTGQRERKALRVSDAIENAFYSGVEIGDDTFSQMAEELGVDVDILKGQYNKFKEANTETAEAAKSISVSPGDSVYNPATGEFVTAPAKPSDPTKPETRKAEDGAIWQWDATKKEWKMVIPGGGDTELDELLSVSEAKALGVPYGTTKGEASGLTVGEESEDMTRQFAQLGFIEDTIANAEKFADASGAAKWSEAIKQGVFGATDFTNLQSYADTIKTNILTLAGDPNIRKFFGPQMSEADVRMMMAGGTTLDPERQSPEEFKEELVRVKDLIARMKQSVPGGVETTPPQENGQYDSIIEVFRQDFGREPTQEELEQIVGGPLTMQTEGTSPFRKVGSDTKQATGSLALGAITGYGSFKDNGEPIWEHGLDIDVKIGDPIASDVDGVVEFVGTNGGFGKQIRVTDVNGNSVWYSHLDGMDVQPGQQIKRGQLLGTGGNTGKVVPLNGGDGSHLDLTVRRPDGTYMPPREIEQRLKKFV